MPVEFGSCPCGGTYVEYHALITIHVGDESVSLDDVAQGRCPECSSIVYNLDVLARLESILRSRTVDRRINVAQSSGTLATG